MTTSLNFHDVKEMEPQCSDDVSWLKVKDDLGNTLTIFMPLAAAQMLAETWAQHRDFVAPRAAEDFVPGLLVEAR